MNKNPMIKSSALRAAITPYPNWYQWRLARQAAGVEKRQKLLKPVQCKMIIGFLSLFTQNRLEETDPMTLMLEYTKLQQGIKSKLPPVMTGREILEHPEAPCRVTLYRRGLRVAETYTIAEIEKFFARRVKTEGRKN